MATKRANEFLWASDLYLDMLKGLREGRTVNSYVLDAQHGKDGEPIEFEVRVVRLGKKRLPRVTEAMVKKARST